MNKSNNGIAVAFLFSIWTVFLLAISYDIVKNASQFVNTIQFKTIDEIGHHGIN